MAAALFRSLLALSVLAISGAVDIGGEAAGSCARLGQSCADPIGGQCTALGSKVSCECAPDQTVVRHRGGERLCQTKLLDIDCRRDTDAACLMVKDSVCAPHEGRCTCLPHFMYTPHRHQCKQIYTRKLPQRQYCQVCKSEGGVCIKEDDQNESNGPLITEDGHTFRLSCSCPAGLGVPRQGSEDKWTPRVCSIRLRPTRGGASVSIPTFTTAAHT